MGWSELIGSQLDRYKITAELGRGGTSRVYRALDTVRQIEVAIKVIPNEAEDRQSFVRRFEREIQVVSQLKHSNIIQILGNGQTDELVYLVMQCITGGTLRQVFGRPLAVPDAVNYVTQMAGALHHAHERNIIHRDVKPSNMLVDTNQPGYIVLTDFGIAKIQGMRGLTKSGTTIGTPEYMAPEQAEGRETDRRADIYSLGCVLYEALAGRPPFVGATPVSVLYQQVHARPSYIRGFNPDVPKELWRIIDRMLAKRPEDRFATAAQLAEMLRPFHTESPRIASTRMTEVPVHRSEETADQGFTPLEGLASERGGVDLFLPDGRLLEINKTAPSETPFPDISQLPTAPPAVPTGLPQLSEVSTQPLGPEPIPGEPPPQAPTPPGTRAPRRTVGSQPLGSRPLTSQPLRLPVRGPGQGSGPLPPGSGPLPPGSGPLPPGIAALSGDEVEATLSQLEGTGRSPGQARAGGRLPTSSHPLPRPAPRPMTGSPWPPAMAAAGQHGQPAMAIAETTPPAWPGQEGGSGWDPATDEVPTITVPAPRRRRRQRHASRTIALGLLALLVLVAGGWVGAQALGGHLNSPGPGSVVRTPTATPTLSSQQVLDVQAAASFRSVVLGTFQDGSCSPANGTTHYTSGQAVTINLCTSSVVASGPMNIVIRQNGVVIMAMSPADVYLSPNGSYFYVRNIGPGTYDVLVTITLKGYRAVARDITFTVG
jgi:serine/threonine protein kinase